MAGPWERYGAAPEAGPWAKYAAPVSEKAPDPTEGMSTFDKAAAGVGKAIVDTGRGIKGLFTDNSAEVEESRRLDKSLMDTGAGFAGNVTGHVGMALLPGGALKGAGALAGAAKAKGAATALNAAGQAVLAPTSIKGAAALGAGLGAIQPATSMGERAWNSGLGAVAGGGSQALFKGAARAISPNTSPEVKALLAEGVTPTPGQILGGGVKRAEEGLASVPFVGDAIRSGQLRAMGDLNASAINRALAPVGEKLPKGMTGRDAIAHVQETLGAKYDALLPKMTLKADGRFAQDMSKLRQMVATGSVNKSSASAFERIMSGDVLGKFKGQNAITGQTLKDIESDLGEQIGRFGASTDADQRLIAQALKETQASLRSLAMRSNPAHAKELRAINEGYANFKRVQKAAAGVGNESGVFTPAQLQSAVKALDRSKDKGSFAKGQAQMQDLSEAGKNVLGNKVPDSGTPYRAMLGLGAGGGGAALAGLIDPMTAAMFAAAPLAYSRPGQNALAAILARRPDAALPTANALRQIAPYATAPALGFANQ